MSGGAADLGDLAGAVRILRRRMVGALTVITIAGFGVVLAALFQIALRLP